MDARVPTNYMDVMAVHYDFIPTIHTASKTLWVQLRHPPPVSLSSGSGMVKLIANDPHLKLPNLSLQVVDIIGTRVMLRPPSLPTGLEPDYTQVTPFVAGNQKLNNGVWHALDHNDHWAYTLKDWTVTLHQYRSWTFGSGKAVAYIVW